MAVDDVTDALRQHFGHASFRPGQESVVRAVRDGRDVLAVMPTGSGKSLGFQLPAVLLLGAPRARRIAAHRLMKDQVDELTRRGIRAAALHSMASPESRGAALDAARAGVLRLLYVAPDRFASPAFRRLVAVPVARFVVDEAHCVSAWGHDFRRLSGAGRHLSRVDQPMHPRLGAVPE